MDDKPKSKNAKKKKFKFTQDLIKLAIKEGWTQKAIADECRTQQSIVSKWSSGRAKGTEDQLKPLLKMYGHKLRRITSRIYWNTNVTTEIANAPIIYEVEGRVIFSYSMANAYRTSNGSLRKHNVPKFRIVIHDQGGALFRVVQQKRIDIGDNGCLIENSHDDAIWHSTIGDQLDIDGLIAAIDDYCNIKKERFIIDAITLPFLIRKALLNHGYPVPDVVKFPSNW